MKKVTSGAKINRSLPEISGNRRKRGYHHGRDENRAYLEANRSRYCEAEYAGTSKILDEFCVVSGYLLKYAIRLRAHHPRSPVGDLCRQLGMSETPFYTWKKKDAHGRLNRLVIDLHARQAHAVRGLPKKV